MSFLAELKRRNVIRVLIAYLAAAWFLIQIADTVVPAYGLPDTVVGILITILAIGLIPAIIVSWAFEWTPEGLKRDAEVSAGESVAPQTGKTLDHIIMVVLALAVGFFAFDKFVLDPGRDAELAEQVRADTRVESYGDRSIAVLPFVNMSSDPEQVYFSDGIAEEILNLLSRIKELRVISRSSAFAHRGEVSIPAVAEALNVTYVLEGSVRKAGEKVRVTAQLIDARTDAHVWSKTWDRDLNDIFAVQDEVAKDVADELNVRLINNRRPTQETDPENYALYLQAKHLYYGEAADQGDKEIPKRLLRIVLERDPDFVPAMTLLTLILGYSGGGADDESEIARLVTTAYELDPEDATANLYMGWGVYVDTGDLQGGLKYIERALQLEPGNTDVLRLAAFVSNLIGRSNDAIILGERALSINPLCIICYPPLYSAYMSSERFEEAANVQKRRIDLIDDAGGRANFALALLHLGRADEAFEILEEINGIESHWLSMTAAALFAGGHQEEAQSRLERLIVCCGEQSAYGIARVYFFAGDADASLFWAEKAFRQGGVFQFMVWDPLLAPLRNTPQWLQWRKEAGLDEETLAAIEFHIPDFGE
ncbi:MAG: hypothetical protein O7H40_11080 [Gammaproteobacteria bacterium]|nr:hypothetical protein [Gammaproteobacteria bacterium]